MKQFLAWLICICIGLSTSQLWGDDEGESRPTRAILYDITVHPDPENSELLNELSDKGDQFITQFYDSWRAGDVYSLTVEGDDAVQIFQRTGGQYYALRSGDSVRLTEAQEDRLEKARPSRSLRRALKPILDSVDLASPHVNTRQDAAYKLGLSQEADYLPILKRRLEGEPSKRVRQAIEEAIHLIMLKHAADDGELITAINGLGDLHSRRARDLIIGIGRAAETNQQQAVAEASAAAIRRIDNHQELVDMFSNLFRGFSTGSVLLIVSFGLAITFGLMGIINMAHGEFVAIGGYTCFIVQNLFSEWFGVQSGAYQYFFYASLPVSFLVAGFVGLIFEKSFIRFLYRRPLESLLATWGLSMVMQQVFRLIFGAANVQVGTPDALMGNYEVMGVSMSFARIFVIGFAGFTVLCTWALLTKTNLGLYIRAVMQNRNMASSIGIPVDRVNSLTFAFGCGLAALAGAALSQIGNVGPSMGQAYIVDSFMVVVVGSVGNLLGAGISAMGIGVVDQFLQPALGPVLGKITVFAVIILFLQWKPGGLFPTKSRSLED